MKYGSVFAGIGGFDLALDSEGFECAWQVEIDEDCNRVLRHYWPEVQRIGDVRAATSNELGHVGLMVGGFPCQDISTSQNGRRSGLAGHRSGLFWELWRLVAELEPGWIIAENVKGILSSNEGRDVWTVVAALEELGYCVAWKTLDSRHFGVPQHRERVFFVGSLGHDGAARVCFEGLSEAPEAAVREAPPQGLEPVAVNPYQLGSNGVGVSYVVPALDSRPDRVVLAPFDRRGVGDAPGPPARLDVRRTRMIGNSVTMPVVRELAARVKAVDMVRN